MLLLLGIFTTALLFALTRAQGALVKWGSAVIVVILAALTDLFLQGLGLLPDLSTRAPSD